MRPSAQPVVVTAMLGCSFIFVLGASTLTAGLSTTITIVVLVLLIPLFMRMPADLVSVLVVIVYVLLLFPARLRIVPLGAAGTPAALLGTAAFAIWSIGFVTNRRWLVRGHRQPLRLVMLGLAASVLASYVAMGWRAHDVIEGKAADRGLLTLMSMTGIALLAADGIRDRVDLRRLLEAITTAGGVVSALGVFQFVTGLDVAARVRIPGFDFVAAGYASERAGFNRIVSTTSHPIEMSVVVVLLLPIALHLGFTAPEGKRRRWWIMAALIGASAPLTVSRTAVLALALVALVLFPGWPARHRLRMFVALTIGLVVMRLAVPGLLGTLRSFLLNGSNDPSVLSRQQSADYVNQIILERPVLGRGFGTFLPQRYEYLDNQVLLTLVETGVLGLLALVAVFVVAGGLTRVARAVSPREDDRDLAQALLACLVVGLGTWLTYDALGFPTSRTLTFLLIGLCAALWRIVRADHPPELDPDSDPVQAVSSAPVREDRAAGSASRAQVGG